MTYDGGVELDSGTLYKSGEHRVNRSQVQYELHRKTFRHDDGMEETHVFLYVPRIESCYVGETEDECFEMLEENFADDTIAWFERKSGKRIVLDPVSGKWVAVAGGPGGVSH